MASAQRIVFITGANRGLGFGLTEIMSESGYMVVAGYRTEERSAQLLERSKKSRSLLPLKVDVTKKRDLADVRDHILERFGRLDILVNNAGVNIKSAAVLDGLEWEDLRQSLQVNVGGPFLTAKYLRPLLKKGQNPKIINISSWMGSIKSSSGGSTPYRISKAALNMLTKNQASEYQQDKITVISLHPGWVRTDMGGRSAPLSVEESVTKILRIVRQITLASTGQFLSLEGKVIPY